MTGYGTLIAPGQLDVLASAKALILDCRFSLADTARGRRDYAIGHIPGAYYADLDADLSAPGTDPALGRHPLPGDAHFADRLRRWGLDDRRQVVVYDDANGAIAARAWWLLRMAGHEHVAVLDGGWAAWLAAGLPVSAAGPANADGPRQAALDRSRVVSVDGLRAELAAGSCLLLDARSRERYAGRSEPIDPVAGHVPGARNRPLAENLDSNGRFKDAAHLRAEFDTLLGTRSPAQVIHMCGSGVTACHNLLAMEHAGLPGSRLFAPSWSGWVSDTSRPVARG